MELIGGFFILTVIVWLGLSICGGGLCAEKRTITKPSKEIR